MNFQQAGYAIAPQLFLPEAVASLKKELSDRITSPHGTRHLQSQIPHLCDRLTSPAFNALLDGYFATPPKLVRSLYFNKTLENNWSVPWHQNRTIAVKEKIEVSGFSAWSVKQGVIHVRPPVAIAENILILRIHLDDTDENNGTLRVIPGSHRNGILGAAEIEAWKVRSPVTCCLSAGDALIMRPLLLHSSLKTKVECDRRVIHLEYAAFDLPGGLQWSEKI